ncbi:hypothetical protein CHELA20_52778 [Hyphomicrobiales bacterium]|nr:hypothetical protein CHELA41_22146 [Hyphomicrobiales bacterium]CAH1682893.1 hypothetical protein CHELA20_52778 [Hyphomicrobiales bacterium]
MFNVAGRHSAAVGEEELLHVPRITLEQRGCAALITDELLGALDHAVALSRLRGNDLARPSDLEALFGARFRLQLGHLALPSAFSGRLPTRPAVTLHVSKKNRHGSPGGRAVPTKAGLSQKRARLATDPSALSTSL